MVSITTRKVGTPVAEPTRTEAGAVDPEPEDEVFRVPVTRTPLPHKVILRGQDIVDELARLRAALADAERERDEAREEAAKTKERARNYAEGQKAMRDEQDRVISLMVKQRDEGWARALALEAALQEIADHGIRCDLNPTINFAGDGMGVYDVMHRLLNDGDASVRRRARAALAGPVP